MQWKRKVEKWKSHPMQPDASKVTSNKAQKSEYRKNHIQHTTHSASLNTVLSVTSMTWCRNRVVTNLSHDCNKLLSTSSAWCGVFTYCKTWCIKTVECIVDRRCQFRSRNRKTRNHVLLNNQSKFYLFFVEDTIQYNTKMISIAPW